MKWDDDHEWVGGRGIYIFRYYTDVPLESLRRTTKIFETDERPRFEPSVPEYKSRTISITFCSVFQICDYKNNQTVDTSMEKEGNCVFLWCKLFMLCTYSSSQSEILYKRPVMHYIRQLSYIIHGLTFLRRGNGDHEVKETTKIALPKPQAPNGLWTSNYVNHYHLSLS